MSLTLVWLLFFLFFILLIVSSIILPRFFVSFIRQWSISVTFLGVFIFSLITSLPELLTILLIPTTISDSSGVIKSFSVILGSNLITGTVFCLLSLFYFKVFSQLTVTKLVRWSCLAVIFINIFLILVLLYPDSFLNWQVVHWSLFSLLFVVFYFIFLVYSSSDNHRFKSRDLSDWEFNKIPFKSSSFALFIWIVFFIALLVGSVFALIYLTTILQQNYQFSDWTVGGVFFAFATTSPEIWTALSFYHLGLGITAWGVIIGSHLFNWILLFLVDLTVNLNVFQILGSNYLNNDLLILTSVSLAFSVLFYLLNWKIFRNKKSTYLFFPIIFTTMLLTVFIVVN